MKRTVFQAFKPYTRVFIPVLAGWACIAMAADVSAKSHGVKYQPVIRVGIYNYAKIAPRELQQAERHATAIFAMARVRIEWTEYSLKPASGWSLSSDPNPDFSVRILHASGVKQGEQTSGVEVMGQSIIPKGTEGPVVGGIANIFYDRMKEVAPASGPCSSAVLAETIAHELGHLMLGPRHSYRGVMKAYWTYSDYVLISQCTLLFLPGQAQALQRAARSLQQGPSSTLAAQN